MICRLGIFILLGFFSNAIFAKDISITVGLKAWLSGFEHNSNDKPKSYEFSAQTESLQDMGVLFGPSITLKYRKLIFGLNRSTGTFDITGKESGTDPFKGNMAYKFTTDISYERTNTDLYAGVSINNNISLVLGRKQLDDKVVSTNRKIVYEDGSVATQSNLKSDGTSKGNFAGITMFSAPNSRRIVYYGAAAVSKLTDDFDANIEGTHLEAGAGLALKNQPIFMTLSFRRQVYVYSDDLGTTTESYTGLSFGVNYLIQR